MELVWGRYWHMDWLQNELNKLPLFETLHKTASHPLQELNPAGGSIFHRKLKYRGQNNIN
jgi:hypothetical protein